MEFELSSSSEEEPPPRRNQNFAAKSRAAQAQAKRVLRLGFAFNAQVDTKQDCIEYDSADTIAYIFQNLQQLGHNVKKINLAQPLASVVKELESFKPDLIFNIGEKRGGPMMEAFWPSVFEELGFPTTGESPHTLLLAHDKHLTKLLLERVGIPTPSWQFINSPKQELKVNMLRFPLIIKPNFEGTLRGIYQSSVVLDEAALRQQAGFALAQHPEGILVEEYVAGNDLTVSFLKHGEEIIIFDPILYTLHSPKENSDYDIYDYQNKITFKSMQRAIFRDPKIKRSLAEAIATIHTDVFPDATFGSCDFRLSKKKLYFLEINCMPSFERESGFFFAAESAGLSPSRVLEMIIQNKLQAIRK